MRNTLVDTSILIDHFRQVKEGKKQTLLYQLAKDKHRLFISMVTYAELHAGKSIWEQEEARNKLREILSGMGIMPLDRNIAEQAGKIRAHYGLSLLDAVIATTALLHKMELATLNVKDFRNIHGLTLFELVAASA